MDIRVYTKGDEATAVDLWQESLFGMADIVDDRIDIKARLSAASQYFFVASVDGKVIGTALAGVNDGVALLDHIAVKPDHRRQGIGRALLKEVESRLGEAGCGALKIQFDAANESAFGFFTSLGFRLEGLVSLNKPLNKTNGHG